jgi:signal transduction histidine kinase
LAVGEINPFRAVTELPLLAMPILVGDGSYQLWKRGDHGRAWIFGLTAMMFLICFGTHAFLVDTARLDSPYLSTYGFLALVALMNYDLAGEVVRQRDLEFRLRQTKSKLQTAVTDERDRIAANLHDSVTQTLFSTAAIADALPQVWRRNPQQGEQGLQDLKHLTKGALAEMRTLLLELHPASLVEQDLGNLLKQLTDATAGRTRLAIGVEIDCQRRFPDDVQIALYRTAQESLNNVVKHSEASHVTLILKDSGDHVELTIQDDGRGFDTYDQPSGMGLGLMRERIESIDGRFQIESEIRHGTTIRVHWSPNMSKNGNHGI